MLIDKIRDSINSYLDLSEKLNDYWYTMKKFKL